MKLKPLLVLITLLIFTTAEQVISKEVQDIYSSKFVAYENTHKSYVYQHTVHGEKVI